MENTFHSPFVLSPPPRYTTRVGRTIAALYARTKRYTSPRLPKEIAFSRLPGVARSRRNYGVLDDVPQAFKSFAGRFPPSRPLRYCHDRLTRSAESVVRVANERRG